MTTPVPALPGLIWTPDEDLLELDGRAGLSSERLGWNLRGLGWDLLASGTSRQVYVQRRGEGQVVLKVTGKDANRHEADLYRAAQANADTPLLDALMPVLWLSPNARMLTMPRASLTLSDAVAHRHIAARTAQAVVRRFERLGLRDTHTNNIGHWQARWWMIDSAAGRHSTPPTRSRP